MDAGMLALLSLGTIGQVTLVVCILGVYSSMYVIYICCHYIKNTRK